MAVAYYDWQDGRQPGPPFNHCSPNLQAVTQELGKLFGGFSLGCYGQRPIRGGVAWSSHSFGAAIDWRIDDSTQRARAIDYLVRNYDMLGISSIHDYIGCRIWHSDRKTWKIQPKSTNGMGQAWAKYLHIETNPDRWADGRSISVRTGSMPHPVDGLIKAAPPGIPFSLKMGGTTDPFRTRWLQQILNERFGGNLKVDGGFGQETHSATIAMQSVLKVTRDGVYGQQSAAALAAWLAVH